MTPLPAAVVQSVTKRFAGPAGDVVALQDAQLSVAAGEFVCLIGASGCGKSTLAAHHRGL